MRFHNAEGMLALLLEEFRQYDMVIQHYPGKNMEMQMACPQSLMIQNSVTAMKQACPPYHTPVVVVPSAPVHSKWSHFESDVDDIIPLSIRSVNLAEPLNASDILPPEFLGQEETDTDWLPQYPVEDLKKAQLNDPDLAKILNWLESKETSPINELYLCSPTVKRFWLTCSQLKVEMGSCTTNEKVILLDSPLWSQPALKRSCKVVMIVLHLAILGKRKL